MITPRAVVIGSALPAIVLLTLVVVPGARSAVGLETRESPARGAFSSSPTSGVPAAASAAGSAAERRAMTLLRRSVRVGSTLGFTGTQIATAWNGQTTTSEVLDVAQRPGGGRTVAVQDVADSSHGRRQISQFPVADGSVGPAHRALDALAAAYELEPAGSGTVAGRRAVEVVASRAEHVAARIWLDDETGLLLRQDVLDDAGRLHRMSAFLELRVGAPAAASTPAPSTGAGWSHVVGPAELQRWRDQGFPCPETLPSGYRLLDVRSETVSPGGSAPGRPVLQLVYGDGLSAVSVFLQSGPLDDGQLAGLTKVGEDDSVVYEKHGWPELLVWQSGRTVITAVGDAGPAELRAVLSGFPQPASVSSDRGALGSLQDAMGSALAWFRG